MNSKTNKDIRISTYVDIDTALELKKLAGDQSMADYVRKILVAEVKRNESNVCDK